MELDIILACRKSVLFYNNTTWEKTADNFDVTMGSFDFAQFADIVGMFIFDTVGRFLKLKNVIEMIGWFLSLTSTY